MDEIWVKLKPMIKKHAKLLSKIYDLDKELKEIKDKIH